MKVGDKVYWFNSNLDVIEESIITGFNAFGGDAWITFRTTKITYPKNLLFESRDALRKYYINRFIDDDIAENEKRLQEVKENLWGQKKEIEEQRSFRRYLPDKFPCPFMRKNKK